MQDLQASRGILHAGVVERRGEIVDEQDKWQWQSIRVFKLAKMIRVMLKTPFF